MSRSASSVNVHVFSWQGESRTFVRKCWHIYVFYHYECVTVTGWYVASAVLPLENKLCTVACCSLCKYQFICMTLFLSVKSKVDFNRLACVADCRWQKYWKCSVHASVHFFVVVVLEAGSVLSEAFVSCVISASRVKQVTQREKLIAKHMRDLSVIPKRSDHHVQFLTGVFFYIMCM